MRVLATRHPEATSNKTPLENSFVGQFSEITDRGITQGKIAAQAIGKIITPQVVHTSPYPRTLQYADILSEHLGIGLKIDKRLREINKGAWEGMPVLDVIELEQQIPETEIPYFRAPDGGENWEDVGRRVAEFIEEQRLNGVKEVLIVSHNHPIRMGIGALLGTPVHTWEDLHLDHASITILEYTDDKWQLHPDYINRVVY